MKLLLVLAITGQFFGSRSACGPSGCPTPVSSAYYTNLGPNYTNSTPFYTQPAPVEYLEPAPTPAKPALSWHRIKFEGRVISVLGVKAAPGKIDYRPEDQPPGWRDQIAAVAEPEPEPKVAAVDATVAIESTPKVLFDQSKFKPDPDPVQSVGAVAPTKAAPANEAWRFNGVNSSQIGEQGLKAVGPEAKAMVESIVEGKPQIVDDSNKYQVSVIGPAEATAPVLEAFRNGPIAEHASQLKVRAFAKTDPLVKDIGLVSDGDPDIIVQSPDGTVRLRLKDFKLGGDGLRAELIRVGALRKSNPNYTPAKDPGVSSAVANGSWGAVAGLFTLGAGLMLLRKPSRAKR